MPSMNRIDMLNCAAGHHDFSDDASECRVCGLPDLDASIPAPADPVRDAAPDMLAALKQAESDQMAYVDRLYRDGPRMAGSLAEARARLAATRAAIAKAEGAA